MKRGLRSRIANALIALACRFDLDAITRCSLWLERLESNRDAWERRLTEVTAEYQAKIIAAELEGKVALETATAALDNANSKVSRLQKLVEEERAHAVTVAATAARQISELQEALQKLQIAKQVVRGANKNKRR